MLAPGFCLQQTNAAPPGGDSPHDKAALKARAQDRRYARSKLGREVMNPVPSWHRFRSCALVGASCSAPQHAYRCKAHSCLDLLARECLRPSLRYVQHATPASAGTYFLDYDTSCDITRYTLGHLLWIAHFESILIRHH